MAEYTLSYTGSEINEKLANMATVEYVDNAVAANPEPDASNEGDILRVSRCTRTRKDTLWMCMRME